LVYYLSYFINNDIIVRVQLLENVYGNCIFTDI
jgi:hypothetical protein